MAYWNPKTKQWQETSVFGQEKEKKKYWNPNTQQWQETSVMSQIANSKKDKRTWFKKSEGNFFQTILGTGGDVTEQGTSGILGMGEKIVDTAMMFADSMYLGNLAQSGTVITAEHHDTARKMREDATEFVKKDLYNEQEIAKKIIADPLKNNLGIDTEAHSVLGKKSEGLVQSAGQLGATALLSPIVPWWLTTGATSFGAESENALNQGATYEQAVGSALISAGAEILTEKLSGGISFGGRTLDDAYLRPLTEKITNKVVKRLTNLGLDAVGEGTEEVITSVISNLGTALYKEESVGELLGSEEALDEYLESFIGGAVLGGVSNAFTGGNKGLTENEQKVVDAEIEKRVQEYTKDGKRYTEEVKETIEKEVYNDLARGNIDIDSIERTLGTFDDYDALSKESEEYTKLYETPFEKLSKKDQDRLAELEKKNSEKSYKDLLAEQRKKISEDVQKSIEKDARLHESYNEKARRGQKYQVDATKKYSEKEMEIINKAVEYGELNNTRKAHEFVDLVAKLSADKGVSFDFTNNQKLKDSGFAIEGKTINGFKQGDSITVNLQSKNALNTVVGHEITHVLEGTELYQELQNSVIEYAKQTGVYDAKKKDIVHLYRNQFQDNDLNKRQELYNAEITADLVGEYIFSDTEFVRNLSTKNRNVFQKVFDEIKYMLKKVNAGSEAERQLLKAKKIFEDVYRETNTNTSSDRQFSVSEVKDTKGRTLTKEQQEKFKDSVVRDENGNLKPVYHGSESMAFTEFNMDKGVWLSETQSYSEVYAGQWHSWRDDFDDAPVRKDINGLEKEVYSDEDLRIYELYADIKNPFDIGEINGTLSDRKVSELANKLGHYVADKTGDMKQGGKVAREVRQLAKDYIGEKAYNFTRTKEFMDYAKNLGFDGFEATEDGKKTYAVFNSADQLKLTTNAKPTNNSDIRFSLSDTVEETKDLMAIHNLHSSELIKQIEMGGLPYPSIAITNPSEIAHEDFGEISLILPKETIDPKKNKYNHIYSADAYTPTFPSVRYEANPKVARAISEKVNYLFDKLPSYYQRSLSAFRDSTNIDERLNSEHGEQGLIDRYLNDYGMKQLYLAEKDEVVPVEIKRTEVEMTEYQQEMSAYFVDKLGEEAVRKFKLAMGFNAKNVRQKWFDKYGEQLRESYAVMLSEDLNMPIEEARGITNGEPESYYYKLMRDTLKYLETGGKTIKEEEDYGKTQKLIDEKINSEEFEQWLQKLFKGIEGKKGIRNDKDVFTPSGKRRSFDQLHDPVTIDNVVKIMRKGDQAGLGAFGTSNMQGASAKEFATIDEVKANREKIGKMSDEEHSAITKQIEEKLFEIAERYSQGKDLIDAKNTLVEAVAKHETKSGIAKYLKQYDYVYKYDSSIADDVIELRNYIRSLPTPYFEAKPRRAVGLDEVAVYVIPNNADAKLKQSLLEGGYSIAEYNPNVEGDRQRVVNQFEDLKFSLSNANQDIAPRTSNNIYAEDIALEGTQEALETTQEATEIAPTNSNVQLENVVYDTEDYAPLTEEQANEFVNSDEEWERMRSLQEADEPLEVDEPIYSSDTASLTKEDLRKVRKGLKDIFEFKRGSTEKLDDVIQRYAVSEHPNRYAIADELRENWGTITEQVEIQDVVEVQNFLKATPINVSPNIKKGVTDYVQTMRKNFNKIKFSKDGIDVDVAYQEMSNVYPDLFPSEITNDIDQFERIVEVANMVRTEQNTMRVDDETIDDMVNKIVEGIRDVRMEKMKNISERNSRYFDKDRLIEEYMQTDDYSDLAGNPNLLKVFHARWDRNQLTDTPKEATTNVNTLDYISEAESKEKTFKEKMQRKWAVFKMNFVDKGAVFEDLSIATKNRLLEAKWDYTMLSSAQAQHFMQNGGGGVKSLKDIRENVNNSGFAKEFDDYMYNLLNIDRMTLDARYGIENKTVYNESVTADVSKKRVSEYETAHPEFKNFAKDVYDYMSYLREQMVHEGILTRETADLWAEMYPHYVPIKRVNKDSESLKKEVETMKDIAENKRKGINAPIKKATGGTTAFEPLFDTIGQRTMQTFKAINKNDFGIELKDTLASVVSEEHQSTDNAIDMVETQDALLQEGKDGRNPTFTVFENGKKVTFEITQEMFEAMSPISDKMRDSGIETLQKASAFHRGVLTQYNPVFALTNGIKDAQDILINSQHPLKTYGKIVEATQQLVKKGEWYREYMKFGGEDNSYFDTETHEFAPTRKGIAKALDTFPLKKIAELNDFIERVPRLAEYIASREMGRSIQESMLDASRVTTNFKAGGDVTKFLNKNGATFLNASVQGATQQVRNVREANMNGLRGWGMLATKFAVAGLPALLLNHLLWDDDEEYEELSDYVKQNYYVVGKYGDGQFIRIPKGRTIAVIQDAVTQIDNMATGNDEADLKKFLDLLVTNLAPNNPIDNNVIAPIVQTLNNKTWYGEDLVPQNLQDMPSAEQYDESTDKMSRAIGKALNISPMKVNYLMDQYTGLVGDMILPMMTPEVTSNSEGAGMLIAPLKDKFTTDGVMNKQVITDFYSKSEELTTNASKGNATSEDVLKNKYLNSVKSEMNALYKQKREIQNSDMSKSEKYDAVREVQKQISALAEKGMNNYEKVEVYSNYGKVDDKHFRLNDAGEWQKINGQQLGKQEKVTEKLGITPNDYWSNKDEYDFAYDNAGKYGIAKTVGGYETFKEYTSALGTIKGDKNIYGETISGSRKTKVVTYINSLNADYYTKILLLKNEYPSDDRYNAEIIEYLNNRNDVSYQEMVDILTELGFYVSKDGTVSWD